MAATTTLTTLVTFNYGSGYFPVGGLIADAAGNLFGTTQYGGPSTTGGGTVFEIAKTSGSYASTPTTLVSFNYANGQSVAGLIADAAGDLFGTTQYGGGAAGAGGNGSVFEIPYIDGSYADTPTTLVSFKDTDGYFPVAGLIADAAGDLFGTTPYGGVGGSAAGGTVFEIPYIDGRYASTPTALVTFNGPNGANPDAGLIADAAGDLFGMTSTGGANGDGTVFEIPKTTSGYGTLITLISFNYMNGESPRATLIADDAGDLFGTTERGGAYGDGTVFEIPYIDGGYASTPTTLVSFNGINGAFPYAGLIADAAGDLFGTTGGTVDSAGTVFEVAKNDGSYASTPTTLASFNNSISSANGVSGSIAGLIADANGDLFGTTEEGGAYGEGSVFEIAKTNTGYAGTPTTLVSFNGTNGANPYAALIADATGDLFGTTSDGGAYGDGSVFEIAKTSTGYAGTPTTLVSFNGTNGANPYAALVADATGNLFGTTEGVGNGVNGAGTVFEIAKTNTGYADTPTTLVSFNGTNGAAPGAGLIADAAGDLFGTTLSGGPSGDNGTVFEIPYIDGSYASTPTTLAGFSVGGAAPNAGLVADAAGDLFGTTSNGDGTVFEIPKSTSGYGALTTLISFNYQNGKQPQDGGSPEGGLIVDAAGDLFGTTAVGGTGRYGTVFEIPYIDGSYASTPTELASFNSASVQQFPGAGLVADAAGDLFGTTASASGSNINGTVFEITKTGGTYASTPTTLGIINDDNQVVPYAGVIADATGDLFGTAAAAGVNGTGTVFELSGTGFQVLCFCRGTLILTESGEVPVEELAVGDRVKTVSGALKPIVWIGFGRDLVTRRNRLARPVIVRQGALADNVPRRDLYLTHGHALYLGGVLIPVENLVNHRSILWDETARVVEYYHIELADHDVLFAEGAPAETYYDAGNRAFFQSTREGSEAGTDKPTCVPVLNSGEIVETVWAELFERAGGQIERDTTDDPDIHLLVDGERLDPTTTNDFVYSFAVERPPAATLLLCSRSGVLSLLGIDRSDHRRLGVPITRIVLWHAGIATSFDHDAPQLREGGCHLAEDGYCWTDGELELPARFFTPLNEAFTLVVHTKQHYMRYPVAAALAEAA